MAKRPRYDSANARRFRTLYEKTMVSRGAEVAIRRAENAAANVEQTAAAHSAAVTSAEDRKTDAVEAAEAGLAAAEENLTKAQENNDGTAAGDYKVNLAAEAVQNARDILARAQAL